jgi:hypothetical protein
VYQHTHTHTHTHTPIYITHTSRQAPPEDVDGDGKVERQDVVEPEGRDVEDIAWQQQVKHVSS